LRRSGQWRTAWADAAVVFGSVPVERATWRWLWRRGVRLGNVSGRLLAREHSRPWVAAVGVARVVVGALVGPVSVLLRLPGAAARANHLPKGIGMIGSVSGRFVQEYAR
jgi:hypothetical protein